MGLRLSANNNGEEKGSCLSARTHAARFVLQQWWRSVVSGASGAAAAVCVSAATQCRACVTLTVTVQRRQRKRRHRGRLRHGSGHHTGHLQRARACCLLVVLLAPLLAPIGGRWMYFAQRRAVALAQIEMRRSSWDRSMCDRSHDVACLCQQQCRTRYDTVHKLDAWCRSNCTIVACKASTTTESVGRRCASCLEAHHSRINTRQPPRM
jgi:hypothetical protein